MTNTLSDNLTKFHLRHCSKNNFQQVKTLIDTGNTCHVDGAISKEIAKTLNYPIVPSKTKSVNSAGRQPIKVLGTIKNVKMRIQQQQQEITVNLPEILVLDKLSVDLNLGRKFLENQNGILKFQNSSSTLTINNANRFQFTNWMDPKCQERKTKLKVLHK